nr:hypothetical protein LTR18_006066 [Exophiala xenobiotica]
MDPTLGLTPSPFLGKAAISQFGGHGNWAQKDELEKLQLSAKRSLYADQFRVDQANCANTEGKSDGSNHKIAMSATCLKKSGGNTMGFYPMALIRGMDVQSDTPYSTQNARPSG